MSGGVDSSVAAALLKQEGYDVVGCFMRLGSDGEGPDPGGGSDPPRPHHQGCCSVNDAADARLVAAILQIPLYVLNFRKDFDRVIDYFVDEYNAGRTPNPCVRCNDWLKFGKLARYARSIDADFVATGHYARVEHPSAGTAGGGPACAASRLLRGLDHAKDQSYVLFGTRLEDLGRMLLPVGHYQKAQVRDIARGLGLPVFDKPDSQEICFVPDNDYADLVARRSPKSSVRGGDILDQEGRVVGRHGGHQHFTIGQRRGVGVALGYPIYVVDKDPEANTVIVGTREHLESRGLVAGRANWLVDLPDARAVPCQVKIRSNSPPVGATVRLTGPKGFEVKFDEPLSAVTPGQAAVCYDGDRVLGGGWIVRALGGAKSESS